MTFSQHIGSLQIEHVFLINTDVEIVPELQLFFEGERSGNQCNSKYKLNGNKHTAEFFPFPEKNILPFTACEMGGDVI